MSDSEEDHVWELTEAVHTGLLDLSSQCLESVPPCVTSCMGLTSLNLSGNSLELVPPSIGSLLTLQELDVSYNKLQSLPDSLGNLKYLTCLKASYNQLACLSPKILAGLSSLEVLHLNDNELQDLPRSLGNLVCLKELHLQYNKLTDLPAELGQLQCLEILNLEGNPLAGYNLPPSEAVARLIQLTSESVASPSGLNLVAFREQMLVLHEERNGTLIRHPHSSLWTEDRGGEQVTNLIDPLLLPGREQESSADLNTTVRVSKAGEGPDVLTLESYKEISENDTVCQLYPGDGDDDEIFIAGPFNATGVSDGAMGDPDEALSVSDSRALHEVMDLPPAAAAILYRTWDAVRTGVQEVQEGRPLTRGGTASAGSASQRLGSASQMVQSARQLLSSASGRAKNSSSSGRPSTGIRSGLGSSHASRRLGLTSAQSGPSEGHGWAAATVSSILGSRVPPPLHSLAGAGGGFEGLPPITFPLTSGVRSMLRQMSNSSTSRPPEASKQSDQHCPTWHRALGPNESETEGEEQGKGEEEEEERSVDRVRRILALSRPDLLETLNLAFEDGHE